MRVLVVHGEGLGNIVEILPLLRTLDGAGIEADLFIAKTTSKFSRDFLTSRRTYLEGDVVDPTEYDGKIETVWGNVQGRSSHLSDIKTLNDLGRQTMRLDKSEVDVYLNAARDMGISEDSFVFDCENELQVEMPKKLYDVVLANGYNWRVGANRWDVKSYPYFPDVAKYFVREGMSVCSVGAPHEHISGTANETGRALAQTCGLLKSAKLVISTDSGVYHCASALNVPTVVIFTFTSVCKNYDKRFHRSVRVVKTDMACQSDCHAKMKWRECTVNKCRDLPVKSVLDVATTIMRKYDGEEL